MLDTRTHYMLRDPYALEALLDQDWRVRDWVTDDEVIEDLVDHPVTTSLLRHLQRLGYIRAEHGVRPQGGRMRLWTFSDVFKVQAVLDLKAETEANLSECVAALVGLGDFLDHLTCGWRALDTNDSDNGVQPRPSPSTRTLLHDRAALEVFIRCAITRAVSRCRFGEAARPTFLL